MSVRYSRYLPSLSIAGDFILLNLIFVFSFCWFIKIDNCFSQEYTIFYVYLNLVWLILVSIFKAGRLNHISPKKTILFNYIKTIVFFFFLFLLYFQVISLNYYPRPYLEVIFILFFTLLLAWKFGLYFAFVIYRRMGYNYKKVIIAGITSQTLDLQNYFESNSLNGYKFIGFIGNGKSEKKKIIGGWNDLKEIVEKNDVDEIYIGWEGIPKDVLRHITAVIQQFPLKVRIVPDFGDFSYKTAELVNYDLIPVLQIHPGPLSFWYNRFIKRSADVLLSIIIILGVLSWFSLILAILSLFGSRQGVFFLQKRTGVDGKIFKLIKFRTMRDNPDADKIQATKNDKRITPVGKFLRKTSLDELPQFINVFFGQMSIVGPRPHMLRHTNQYRKLVQKFMIRHTVKPGITGLAQVRGFRGEINKISELKQRVSFDVNYIENWSFGLDLKIMLLTILRLINGDKKAY